jgi:hypothetical protein
MFEFVLPSSFMAACGWPMMPPGFRPLTPGPFYYPSYWTGLGIVWNGNNG